MERRLLWKGFVLYKTSGQYMPTISWFLNSKWSSIFATAVQLLLPSNSLSRRASTRGSVEDLLSGTSADNESSHLKSTYC